MEVIDTVPADSLETGDTISVDDDEIEVTKILDCEDINGVSFEGYSLVHGTVQTYEAAHDKLIDILGA